MSAGTANRIEVIQNYLMGEYLVDSPEEAERKLHNYCKELLALYRETEALRAEWMTKALQLSFADEYGEFCAKGRHISFVEWFALKEGK